MKQALDLAFVILHYLNMEDTIETVESIRNKVDTGAYHIVVVDNASPDDSGKELEARYRNAQHVDVILNERNLGFSAGNNAGIIHLRTLYSPKFIILSNNDIQLYDDHLFEKTNAEYQRSGFAVMGPMILTADGRCDANPISDVPYSRKECENEILQYQRLIRRAENGTYKLWAKYDYYMKKFVTRYRVQHQGPVQKDRSAGVFLQKRENVVLHGCFMIFSEKYFEHFEGLDVRTFMYSEENILYTHMQHLSLIMLYNPDIIVYHKEGASVNNAFKGGIDAKVFRYRTKIQAHQGYLSLLDELDIQ